jgi:hypothetical protein
LLACGFQGVVEGRRHFPSRQVTEGLRGYLDKRNVIATQRRRCPLFPNEEQLVKQWNELAGVARLIR